MTALFIGVCAFTEPGDKVMLLTPVYYPFYTAVEGHGRQLVKSSLVEKDGKYEMKFEDIEEKIIKNPQLVNKRVLVFSGKDYHPGVIGIVAAHFCEKYSKPCLVISIGDDGIAKGSCRSVEGFNI